MVCLMLIFLFSYQKKRVYYIILQNVGQFAQKKNVNISTASSSISQSEL